MRQSHHHFLPSQLSRQGCWFPDLPFPSSQESASERPGAVQGAPIGAAERTLDGEDRSEMIQEEGKERRTPLDF